MTEDELRRRLSICEAELMRQTGCTAQEVASLYATISIPVINYRFAEAYQRGRRAGFLDAKEAEGEKQ